MKKSLFTAIALAAVISLNSCGDKPENKSKSKIKEKPEITTEAPTSPVEDDKYTVIDAFENITIEFSDSYPSNIRFFYNTSESTYNNKIDYDCMVKTADLDKIVIEAKADYSKYEDDLKEMGYMFESDTKLYEISTDEITTNILRESQLTDENVQTIMEWCELIADREYIDKIYVLMPKDGMFLKEYKCTDKGETGILSSECWKEMENKIPSNQIFVIRNTPTSGYEVFSFGVKLEKGKITECTRLNSEGRRDSNNQVITESVDEKNINDYFNDILEYYKSKGYSFDLKEIQIPRETT